MHWGGILPCPNNVVCSPWPSQSLPTQHPRYDQQKELIDESSSEEDEEHVVNTLPPYCSLEL